MSFICHIHNYTEYNQQWNVFSAFNPSKCTHTWSSGQPTLRRPGSSWGFGALLKGLTSVVDISHRSRDSNPQPRVTSLTLYPLEPRLPLLIRPTGLEFDTPVLTEHLFKLHYASLKYIWTNLHCLKTASFNNAEFSRMFPKILYKKCCTNDRQN